MGRVLQTGGWIGEEAGPDVYVDQKEQVFPTLSSEMIDRMEPYGRIRSFEAGAFLYRSGERGVDLHVVLEGAVEILSDSLDEEPSVVVTYGRHQFTGEFDQLSRRATLVSARAVQPARVLCFDRADFRRLTEAQPDIADILWRALILRRQGMIQNAVGGTILIGSRVDPEFLRIGRFLSRNGCPHRQLDIDEDPDARRLLAAAGAGADDLPVVIVGGRAVLRHPDDRNLSDTLGVSEPVDADHIHDLAVIGAGPAGLAAAVGAASEGVDTIVVDTVGPGGQAGTSSRIENYPGFPLGLSGQTLAAKALVQAQKFGARLMVARGIEAIECERCPFVLRLDSGERITARAVLVAVGATYRSLELDGIDRFHGRGIHHAATGMEAKLCHDADVVVVGGGNSAGQAALFLSSHARHVHVLVRGSELADTMSDYLLRRLEASDRISIHTGATVTGLDGDSALTRVRWSCRDGTERLAEASNLFLMLGAVPNTGWLRGCVELDRHGFVLTGEADGVGTGRYRTSRPGIFAAGDVRSGSVKRVAAAVGEGAVVLSEIHRWLSASCGRSGPR
ncbi:FAD-dependent oxidoreductase [Microvirga yunnanensis]|uniref:FAD-dependent oxidoreductase n=1 Tax=Microvirga yunnanensis TaxID=2953740 RepID=UPI0021C5BC19|nr:MULTISPECIES: cyclic nucleotide-binding domain-containing thioredoxin-disulfide reductase [unclassified Microvirga]